MERVVAFGKTIRNNWKKSALGAAALFYAAATIKEKYEIDVLMRAACKEASKYGDSLIAMDRNPTMVTVILNPVANKRRAKQNYEKYCEPLLHLAGLQVDVIHTTSEGNAKEIIETLRGTEAIIVAGGDGTLSETVTGLLRRNDNANSFPLGVLPLGRTNTVAKSLFPGGDGVEMVKQLIQACMAIIEGGTVWKDAMKIEPIVQEDEAPRRPIYAMSSLEWGAFRDTLARKDKYWFYGSWRDYAAYIFNGYKESLTWDCSGIITYTIPCLGCSNCIPRKPEIKRNWSFILPQSTKLEQETTVNPKCATKQEVCFKTCDFKINTTNHQEQLPSLSVVLGKNKYTYWDFVTEGWNRLKFETGKKPTEKFNKDIAERLSNNHTQVIPVRTVELLPRNVKEDVKIEIDKEEFDVKPVKITLLPKVVKFFCSQPQLNA